MPTFRSGFRLPMIFSALKMILLIQMIIQKAEKILTNIE
jgi:hypothetical protein